MKRVLIVIASMLLAGSSSALAQGTAFTYQGVLMNDGETANGDHDFRFTLYDQATNGTPQAGPIETNGVPVTNGLFTVRLDFGASVFSGAPRWLEVAVKNSLTDSLPLVLSPRQPITPTPYAINAANLMNLDQTPIDIKVAGQRALRLEPTSLYGDPQISGAPNIIGGSSANVVSFEATGATIAGGGAVSFHGADNRNLIESSFATIGGGMSNSISTQAESAVIAGGARNTIQSEGVHSTIGGGFLNFIHEDAGTATIGGGRENTITRDGGTISGGWGHTAAGYATVAGGQYNHSLGSFSTVAGGTGNRNDREYGAIGGGQSNEVSGAYSTIGGGRLNTSGGFAATVAGGYLNLASSQASTVGGGQNNWAGHEASTIAGGAANTTIGDYAAIGGGSGNIASDGFATVGGGLSNTSGAPASVVGGGEHNSASGWWATIGGGERNVSTANRATVAGGLSNSATAEQATIGGGGGNVSSGIQSTVAGGGANESSGVGSTVGGGQFHDCTGQNATIAGGLENTATNYSSTIGGGIANFCGGEYATVAGGLRQFGTGRGSFIGGGHFNFSLGIFSTISGGESNRVPILEARYATISGGLSNLCQGYAATIPGGEANRVDGRHGFAAGHRAHARHDGAFIWADSSNFDFASSNRNEFSARATGGVRFVSAIDNLTGEPTAGVSLASGSGAWSMLSDRNAKENFSTANARAVLDKVAALPLATWNYKSQDKSVRHIGPTAQDFHAAFGVGENDRTIATVDADGVALAAIQGLNQKLEEQLKAKDAHIETLEHRIESLEKVLTAISARMPK